MSSALGDGATAAGSEERAAPATGAAPASVLPLVSVIIPSYNRPAYLREALASAAAQSYPNLEIIVHDNASPLDPQPIVEGFGDRRISFYRNERNLGVTGNVARALRRATGKYFALLGDDDLWHPTFVATLVEALEAYPEAVVAFCDHDVIDECGQVDARLSAATTRRYGRHLLHEGLYRRFGEIALVRRSICIMSAALLRRDAAAWGDLPDELSMGLDLYLAYLAVRSGGACCYAPRRLSHYRFHRQSLTSGLVEPDSRIGNARSALFYWGRFLGDASVSECRPYFELKRGANALVIVMTLLRCGESRAALRELGSFLRQGLLSPRLLFYHLVYALRLRRARA